MSVYSGNEKILIVDDDEKQLRIARKLLTLLGYKVECALYGIEAIKFIETEIVDLVILDMSKGNYLDGLGTYLEILKIRSDQRTIIVIGSFENRLVKETIKLGTGRYVKKPYTQREIGTAVREELDRK